MTLKIKTIHFYKYFLYSYHKPGDMLSPGDTRWTATWFTRKSWAPQPSKVRSASQEQKQISLKLSYTSLRWARDADMGTSFCSKLQHWTKPNITTIKSSSSLLTADTSPVPTVWALNFTLSSLNLAKDNHLSFLVHAPLPHAHLCYCHSVLVMLTLCSKNK